jgi:ubiquinone biosynthesis protein
VKEFVQREVLSSAPVLARLPRDIDDVARSLVRGDLRLRVSLFSEPEDVKTVRGIVNLLTTGLVGSALVLASAVLMTVEPGPGQLVGLVRSVGAVGFAFSTLLLLRVIVRLLNERER